MQHELQRDRAAAGSPGKGYVEEEIGECLLALGQIEEARPWFAVAYRRLQREAWLRAEEPERLARLKELGGE